jgi:hypothetical protein
VHHISNFIERYDLGRHIPVVRVERRARTGEFYLFLGLESQDELALPPDVETCIASITFLSSPIDDRLSLEQIKEMTGAELDVREYTRRIFYIPLQPNLDDDPFDIDDFQALDEGVAVASEPQGLQHSDRLLLWLSAAGAGSVDVFCQTCSTLGIAATNTEAHHILRRLRLLGHIETSVNGKQWYVAPPTLVQTQDPAAQDLFFLAGQRDEQLLNTLRNTADVRAIPQVDNDGPTVVQVAAPDGQELVASLQLLDPTINLMFGGAVAQRLADALPHLTEWMNMLTPLDGIKPSLYACKRYKGAHFVDYNFDETSGFYQLWKADEKPSRFARPVYTLFYDEQSRRWLRGDWYGLRFLDLNEQGQSCKVRYNPANFQLAIPYDWRWPELYERALVLASGRLPRRSRNWLIYEAITPHLIATLKPKLRLELEDEEYA